MSAKMNQFTERHTFRITKTQKQTLNKLSKYGINVNWFIRDAIKEKIARDWPEIKERQNKNKCPF